MYPRIDRQLGIQDATPSPELLQKQLQPVASVDVPNKYDTLSLD